MSKKINLRDRVEDGEIDLSMSDLQEVPVRDIVSQCITFKIHPYPFSMVLIA